MTNRCDRSIFSLSHMPCNAINFVFFVQILVNFVVQIFYHKGHKEKYQRIGGIFAACDSTAPICPLTPCVALIVRFG